VRHWYQVARRAALRAWRSVLKKLTLLVGAEQLARIGDVLNEKLFDSLHKGSCGLLARALGAGAVTSGCDRRIAAADPAKQADALAAAQDVRHKHEKIGWIRTASYLLVALAPLHFAVGGVTLSVAVPASVALSADLLTVLPN
jgi:hypothetical protein